ncbi:uncharacterized protein FOMMEDRAFT_141520 [Fomitiporia mediterranea MF3/22]|uniref:uncharacterized protein n=1 Tax=Fomitiporia mediterranea (strain MF3/22) TaxID=694068 RepID=UPI0004407366|nr:uncharacterized protein FOMMEDRAFT_141520 [Fomitiporia mediterranea MF3/22]EJD02495.1 hypothetical protein FOMMEDRAFT_141520 [Fomitiporia mediterranea MF3/22]
MGPHWGGYSALKYLFVFGASNCDVGYNSECPPPTKEEPLGVPFPGITYAEEGKPNWVGYLARDLCPSGSGDVHPLLVFDYAKGGAIVPDVVLQVSDQFVEKAGKKPSWAPWAAGNSLFSTWIGGNDCGRKYRFDPAESIDRLFEIQEKLYEAGARNFLFINLPPMKRSPLGSSQGKLQRSSKDPYYTWNTILRSYAHGFADEHPDASVFVFSAWNLFSEILDDPVAHGFNTDDPSRAFGGIWNDTLHPTTRVHRLIAESVKDFLCNAKVGEHEERMPVLFGE